MFKHPKSDLFYSVVIFTLALTACSSEKQPFEGRLELEREACVTSGGTFHADVKVGNSTCECCLKYTDENKTTCEIGSSIACYHSWVCDSSNYTCRECNDGDTKCEIDQIQVCVSGQWKDKKRCDSGRCSQDMKYCEPESDTCENKCHDGVLTKCLTDEQDNHKSIIYKCDFGCNGADQCCDKPDFKCNGNNLIAGCDLNDNNNIITIECEGGCNDDIGCIPIELNPNEDKKCKIEDGNSRCVKKDDANPGDDQYEQQECQDGKWFTTVESCAACTPDAKTCARCESNTTQCKDGKISLCDAWGRWNELKVCPNGCDEYGLSCKDDKPAELECENPKYFCKDETLQLQCEDGTTQEATQEEKNKCGSCLKQSEQSVDAEHLYNICENIFNDMFCQENKCVDMAGNSSSFDSLEARKPQPILCLNHDSYFIKNKDSCDNFYKSINEIIAKIEKPDNDCIIKMESKIDGISPGCYTIPTHNDYHEVSFSVKDEDGNQAFEYCYAGCNDDNTGCKDIYKCDNNEVLKCTGGEWKQVSSCNSCKTTRNVISTNNNLCDEGGDPVVSECDETNKYFCKGGELFYCDNDLKKTNPASRIKSCGLCFGNNDHYVDQDELWQICTNQYADKKCEKNRCMSITDLSSDVICFDGDAIPIPDTDCKSFNEVIAETNISINKLISSSFFCIKVLDLSDASNSILNDIKKNASLLIAFIQDLSTEEKDSYKNNLEEFIDYLINYTSYIKEKFVNILQNSEYGCHSYTFTYNDQDEQIFFYVSKNSHVKYCVGGCDNQTGCQDIYKCSDDAKIQICQEIGKDIGFWTDSETRCTSCQSNGITISSNPNVFCMSASLPSPSEAP